MADTASAALNQAGTAAEPWLPDFCRLPILFSTMVAAEVAVLVIALAPSSEPSWSGERLTAASLFALWLALCNAILLCRLRGPLCRLPQPFSAVTAWALPVAATALGSLLVHELDVALQTGFSLPIELRARFLGHNAAIAALLGAVLLRYFHVQEQWALQERAHVRAEVEALQARIRPHFLFNSMNTIASLVRRDPDTAERVVEDLSDLFRAALSGNGGDATLDEELQLCRRYLDIEMLRLGPRLGIDWQIASDVPLDLPMPRLLLQPLLENAVLHGISRLPQGGTIELKVRADASTVQLEIRNPSPARPQQSTAGGHRLAQPNIRQRLAYHYGQRAQMTAGYADGYYSVQIRIPRQN